MSAKFDQIVAREQKFFAPGVRRWPVALVRGEGSRVWDVDGTEFIDMTAGWGVTALGHSHPALVEAITDQARTLMQTTNVVYSEPQLELAERLDGITPDNMHRSFFVSSGSEANEGAIKLAHRATGRSGYVSTFNSFHGRTLGSLGVLGQDKYRAPWNAILKEASFVPYGDLEAAKAAIGEDTAAMIVEPIQGEGGVNVPPDGYLKGLEAACHAAGALLILDEVQTCIGRTGRWLARDHSDVRPDIITLGKGIGGGVPLAAFTATDDVFDSLVPGDHGGTYAGNLMTCRAGCTVMQVIQDEGLVERAASTGDAIMSRLEELQKELPDRIEGVRGAGLLIGLIVREPELAASTHTQLRERGVLMNLTADRVLRLFPALNIPQSDLDQALEILEDLIRA